MEVHGSNPGGRKGGSELGWQTRESKNGWLRPSTGFSMAFGTE